MEMLYTLNSMFNFNKNNSIILIILLIISSYMHAQEDPKNENYYSEEEILLINSDRLLKLMTEQIEEQQKRYENKLLLWDGDMPERDVWLKDSEYQELLNQWRSNRPETSKITFKIDLDITIGCRDNRLSSVACYDVEDEAIIVVGTGYPFEAQLNKFDIDLNNEEEWVVKYYEQKFDIGRDTMRKFQDDIKLYATIVSKGEKNWLEVEDWILRIRGETVNLIVSVDLVPIFKVQPVYPRRAQERGMEGYVIVAFTITESGTIEEPYVIEGKCRNAKNRDGEYNDCSMFNSATLRAAKELKYKPTVRDGRAIAINDVPHKFTYEIDDSYDQN